jgi:putative endonuclease
MWYVYILQSKKDDEYFHKGSTHDIGSRLEQHNAGYVTSTRTRRPYRLVYYEAYVSERAARIREHAIKNSGAVSIPLLRRIRESLKDD